MFLIKIYKMEISKNTNGFTLIEILIATVIITVASLGVASLTIGVIRGNSFSKRLTTATTLAQDRLEEIKGIGYSNAPMGNTPGTYGDIPNFGGYKRDTSVAYVNGDPASKMKKIDVTVYWDSDKRHVTV